MEFRDPAVLKELAAQKEKEWKEISEKRYSADDRTVVLRKISFEGKNSLNENCDHFLFILHS
jgi:hypothetical protein